ncbi:hypothetical protein ACFX15_031882 [Malus domestica]
MKNKSFLEMEFGRRNTGVHFSKEPNNRRPPSLTPNNYPAALSTPPISERSRQQEQVGAATALSLSHLTEETMSSNPQFSTKGVVFDEGTVTDADASTTAVKAKADEMIEAQVNDVKT